MECQICFEIFDSKNFLPKILVKCGHSICRICLDRLCYKSTIISCPICRGKSRIQKKDYIPTNYSLLEIIENNKINEKTKNLLEKYKYFDDNYYKHISQLIVRKHEPKNLLLTKISNEDFIYLEEIDNLKSSFFNPNPRRNKRYNFNKNSIFRYFFDEYSSSITMYRMSSQCKHNHSCLESIIRSVCNYAGSVVVLNILAKILMKIFNFKKSFKEAREKIQILIFIIISLRKIFKCLVAYYMDDLLKMR